MQELKWREPEKIEFHLADNIFVKMIAMGKGGTIAKGHKHTFDHTSFLATGSFRMWKNGECIGDFHAPTGIFIEKDTVHEMVALEDNTTFFCIHNTHEIPEDELHQRLVTKE